MRPKRDLMASGWLRSIWAAPALLLFTALVVPPVSPEYDWMMEGNSEKSDFGFWMDGGGDVNGDGYDDLLVGAPSVSHNFVGEGAVYLYYGGPDGLSLEPDWVAYGAHDSSGFGRCLSIKGDVNGDGFSDILIGSHQHKNTKVNEGKVLLYLGGPDGPDSIPYWTMVSGRKGAKLGEAVVFAGDLNHDGYDEICVGAHGWDDDETLGEFGNKAGKFWVFKGNADGIDPTPIMACVGIVEDANLGVSMDRAGDVNGDGIDDLHIGGYIFLIGDGMLCTFHGGAAGPDGIPDFMAAGGAMDTSFYAVNLSSAGDINGDGYMDVVVGAPRFDANGIYQSGKLHIHYGGDGGLDPVIGWTATGTQYDERWAFNVNEAGDINHDGYGDLLVGAKYFDNEADSNAGKAELFLGGPKGPQRNPTWTFVGPDSGSTVGNNLCVAGDVNGDGHDDIIVSGNEYTGDLNREGVVYAFYGQPQQCDPPQHPNIYFITPNSVTIGWDWLYGAHKYRFYMKRMDGPAPQYIIPTQDSVVTIGGLVAGAHYKAYVTAKCDGGWTDRSLVLDFYTPLHREGELVQMDVYPTLASQSISVALGTATGPVGISIMDMRGNVVFYRQFMVDVANTVIVINEIADLPAGNYFITAQSPESRISRQFIRQ